MNHAGFIDFGYLKAAAASCLGVDRRELTPKAQQCVKWVDEAGKKIPGESRFLRLYWYDGAFDPRDQRHAQQRKFFDAIEQTPGVQLRLGHIQELTPKWQYPVKAALKASGVDLATFEKHFQFRPDLGQKGVDTRITLDLVRLAQRHVYDTAILVAGDRDLAEPVRAAQDEGRRVIVAVPEGAGLARELRFLADAVVTIGKAELRSMFKVAAAADRKGTTNLR
jgi:uncharacterized LabA/DUF88 family protein